DGVVPGVVAGTCPGGEHAASRTTGVANRAAATLRLAGVNMRRAYPVTTTITPGGWSATSGILGATGASSSLPTSSAAACSPSALPKYTVVAVTSGSVRLPVSVTFQPASRSRVAARSAAPATSEMLNTR